MPYSTSTRRQVIPRPARRRGAGRHDQVVPAGTGQTVAQQLGGAAFLPRVYIAFDPPYSTAPGWLEVTEFVDQDQPITITAGRADGLSDPNAATCSLTVDNSDGRWTPTNPSGAWYGQIRKGCWLRVDLLPLSGTVSRRFTGYITALPTTLAGASAQSQISASDVFVLLTQAPKLSTMLVEEWMSDPVGAPYITGYWPLAEPSGATYALDVSGQAPAGRQALQVRTYGAPPNAGITWASTPAPGLDGRSTVAFAPTGTPLAASAGGTTNALPNGSYLQGTVTLPAVVQITCWIRTTTVRQPIWSWADPTANYCCGVDLDSQGYLQIWQSQISFNTPLTVDILANRASRLPVTDGVWHQVSLRVQTVAASGGTYAYWSLAVDGAQTYALNGYPSPATGLCPSGAMSRFLIGAAEGWNAAAQNSGLSMFTGAISDLVIHTIPQATITPDWYTSWVAGTTGHTGESTGQRVARLVSYGGLPTPQTAVTLPGTLLTVYQPNTGTSPVLNVGTTAHPAGVQQINGKNVLDSLRVVAHTEAMPLFADAYGRITLQASTVRNNPAAAVSITASDLDPSTGWADDFQYTINQAIITPSGQGSITVNTGGSTSQALYGVYSTSVETVNLNAAEAASLGAAIIGAGAAPPPRTAPLAVEAATLAQQPGYGAAWYDAVLAVTVSSLVQVTGWQEQTPYGAGGTSTHIVEGWTETITAGLHLIAWNTSAPQGPCLTLDSPTLGVTDTPSLTLPY